jgi:acetyl esterase/lipase
MPSPRDRLHPEIAVTISGWPFEHTNAETLPLGRARDVSTPLSDAVVRSDHLVPGGEDPDVPVRVHRPADMPGILPCLYSIHGGGYVKGTYAMDDKMFDAMSPALGVVGVSVEYRLAPETVYPGPLEDCYRGLAWAFDHADELGIDRDRFGIRGVSGGGGLAAALALLARDRGEPPIAFQLLDCPMLDDRQITPSSQQDALPIWSRESNTWCWQAFLGPWYGRDDVPYTASPSRARDEDLIGLPPTFISVGAIDGFVDEDVDYAIRLNRAGVDVELHVYPGACHGYQMAVDCEITRQSQHNLMNWLARQIQPKPSNPATRYPDQS